MYYLLLILATVFFSIQFVFNKVYQREVGAGFLSSCSFLAISSAIFGLILFAINGFRLQITPYSCLMALCATGISVGCGYFGIVALSISDLAKYSLYMMLGGMAVPFAYGILLGGDAVTWQKIACFITIAAALFINARGESKKKDDWRARACYAFIFLFNGLSGVVTTLHQLPPSGMTAVPANDYTILTMLMNILFAAIALIAAKLRGAVLPKNGRKAILAAGGYGVVHGIASVLVLLSILHIEPSVQYPIITGGCVILSVVFGLFFGEKITKKSAICALITLAGTLVLMI